MVNTLFGGSRLFETLTKGGEANELVRLSMVHLLSGAVPLYVVNEYPKSGERGSGRCWAAL